MRRTDDELEADCVWDILVDEAGAPPPLREFFVRWFVRPIVDHDGCLFCFHSRLGFQCVFVRSSSNQDWRVQCELREEEIADRRRKLMSATESLGDLLASLKRPIHSL